MATGGESSPKSKRPNVVEQDLFTSQKELVIPRKRWLRPYITEKMLTGT